MKNPAEGRGLVGPGLDQPFTTILFPGQHKRRRALATLLLAEQVARAGHGPEIRLLVWEGQSAARTAAVSPGTVALGSSAWRNRA
jgi:hypothetical protein